MMIRHNGIDNIKLVFVLSPFIWNVRGKITTILSGYLTCRQNLKRESKYAAIIFGHCKCVVFYGRRLLTHGMTGTVASYDSNTVSITWLLQLIVDSMTDEDQKSTSSDKSHRLSVETQNIKEYSNSLK